MRVMNLLWACSITLVSLWWCITTASPVPSRISDAWTTAANGLHLSPLIIPSICMCQSFASVLVRTYDDMRTTSPPLPSVPCEDVRTSWRAITNITGLTMLHDDLIIPPSDDAWITTEGPHMKVWQRDVSSTDDITWYNDNRLSSSSEHHHRMAMIAWRHQESDDMLNESMGLFGRHATVDVANGHRETAGAAWTADVIRSMRRTIGIEWLPRVLRQAIIVRDYYRAMDIIDGTRTQLVFTGFSLGGYWAQIAALHLATLDTIANTWHVIPTIVYAANGIEDTVTDYHAHMFPIINATAASSSVAPPLLNIITQYEADPSAERAPSPIAAIINMIHIDDAIPRMDCHLGTVCTWSYTDIPLLHKRVDGASTAERNVYAIAIHESHIYGRKPHVGGDIAKLVTSPQPVPEMIRLWNSQSIAHGYEPICYTGVHYSAWYGSCRREADRWQQRLAARTRTDRRRDL